MTTGGDRINVRDISRSKGIAIGRNVQAHVTEGIGGAELAQLLDSAYQWIEARPDDPDVDKAELTETVKKVEEEVAKGEQANPNKVQRWLKTLAGVAPDVLDVTVAALASPAAGVAAVVRTMAERFKNGSSTATEQA